MVDPLRKFKRLLNINGIVTIDGYDSKSAYEKDVSKLFLNVNNVLDDLFLDHIRTLCAYSKGMPDVVKQVEIYNQLLKITKV